MIETNDININNEFVAIAIHWANLKVPYRHRGINIRGCDCTGLIIGIAKELGYLRNYKLRYYPIDWNLHAGASDIITKELERVADEIKKNDVSVGDLIVFRFGNCISHVGIYIGNDLFIHTTKNNRCRYGRLKQSKWSDRWTKTYRLNKNKMEQFNV